MGPRDLSRGTFECCSGSEGPARSPALNDRRCPDVPWWRGGGRVSLAQGLEGCKSPVFRGQAPWEGPLGCRPNFKVSRQEAG